MYRSIILFILIILKSFSLPAQTDWTLSSQSEGIKIYTSNVPDSKIKAVKVECDIQATMSQFVTVLMDVKKSQEWLYHTRLCRVIKTVSAQGYLLLLHYYASLAGPRP